MKCANCLVQLETGGRLARWQARRHLAKCAACRQAMQSWRLFQTSSRDVEQLTLEQRKLWVEVAESQDSDQVVAAVQHGSFWEAKRPPAWQIAAAGVACLLICGWCLLFRTSPPQNHTVHQEQMTAAHPNPVQPGDRLSIQSSNERLTTPIVTVVSLSRELEQLDADIVKTQRQIELLQKQLERHVVSQKIEALLTQHDRW